MGTACGETYQLREELAGISWEANILDGSEGSQSIYLWHRRAAVEPTTSSSHIRLKLVTLKTIAGSERSLSLAWAKV